MEEVPCRTSCAPPRTLLYAYFNRSGSKGAFSFPGATRDRFCCTVEPSPGHIRCRSNLCVCFVAFFAGSLGPSGRDDQSSSNMLRGYVVGRFGLFGMQRLQGSLFMCDFGCFLVRLCVSGATSECTKIARFSLCGCGCDFTAPGKIARILRPQNARFPLRRKSLPNRDLFCDENG